MKKLGLITLTLVFALGSLGVAYAAWDDQIQIDATVNTGEMEVRFRQTGTEATDGNYDKIGVDSVTHKVLTVTLDDLYPREEPISWADRANFCKLKVNIKNDSTMPVQLTSIDVKRVSGSGPVALYDNLMMLIEASHYSHAFPVKNLSAVVLEDLVLEPGEDTDSAGHGSHFTYYIWLDEDAGNDLQDESVEVEVTLNWGQANLA